jgi:hypothetical protein
MPLSEQEQRLLDEMERNLYQNDADFVSAVGSRRLRPNYRGIVIGAILVVVGVIVLIIGVGSRLSVVGVVGFVVMFAGVLIALTPARAPRTAAGAEDSAKRPSTPRAGSKSPGFMANLNDRWERRQEERDN